METSSALAGPDSQGPSHRPSQEQGSQRGHWDSPSPRHRAPSWGQGEAETWLGCGPSSLGPWPGRAGLWGAGEQLC